MGEKQLDPADPCLGGLSKCHEEHKNRPAEPCHRSGSITQCLFFYITKLGGHLLHTSGNLFGFPPWQSKGSLEPRRPLPRPLLLPLDSAARTSEGKSLHGLRPEGEFLGNA